MDDSAHKTIQSFGKRSNVVVLVITFLFAMVGACLAIFTNGKGLWGVWIPLCFITIPPIHYLCRRVQSLSAQLETLEKNMSKS